MRIERIEHFVTYEHFLFSEGAFRLATGIAARRLRNGFPLGYIEPGDVVTATPSSPLIIAPLTTISVHPHAHPTLADAERLTEQLYERLLRLSWPLRSRVAQELLQLLTFPKLVVQERSRRGIRVTQQVLAELVGVTRVAIASELRQLVQAGAIQTGYGQLFVLDASLLEQAARPTKQR